MKDTKDKEESLKQLKDAEEVGAWEQKLFAKADDPPVAQPLPPQITEKQPPEESDIETSDEKIDDNREDKDRTMTENELAITLARLEDLWEDISTQKDLHRAARSLKHLEVAKVEDAEKRRGHLREAQEMLPATKVDEDARRKYESYVGLQKEVKNLVNDTRAFRKITTDGMKQQAFRAQESQTRFKKFDDFIATRSAELEAREKQLGSKEARVKVQQVVGDWKQPEATGSQRFVPEWKARAEAELARLTSERDALKQQCAHDNSKELEEEVDRLTMAVASAEKEEKKLKKRIQRMEKEIPLTEKRTEVWERLIAYDRPLFETNAVHVAYMRTTLEILKMEQYIETEKLKEAQAFAEHELKMGKGEELGHDVLVTQRDSKMKEAQGKLDTIVSQTKNSKRKVKGMQVIDEKQSLAACETTLELRVEIAELEAELNMLEKKLEVYELSGR
ncbi:hypothetical protein CPB85DRAFT_1442198 [Mucidula mucida]|nr:hypothetical protein CPB85DRAFT_1442198 [Mucidula mucida]